MKDMIKIAGEMHCGTSRLKTWCMKTVYLQVQGELKKNNPVTSVAWTLTPSSGLLWHHTHGKCRQNTQTEKIKRNKLKKIKII